MTDLFDYDANANSLGCYNDALAGIRLRATAEKPNYATLVADEVNGVPYITDVATKMRLYKHAPCPICDVSEWRWSREILPTCKACAAPERNDNEES